MKKWKRILSILLVIAMCVTLCPSSLYAEEQAAPETATTEVQKAPEQKTEEKKEEKPETPSEDKSEDKTEAPKEDKTEATTEEKSEEKKEDKKSDDKTEDKKSDEKTNEKKSDDDDIQLEITEVSKNAGETADAKDVKVKTYFDKNSISIGGDFSMFVSVTNNSSKEADVTVKLDGNPEYISIQDSNFGTIIFQGKEYKTSKVTDSNGKFAGVRIYNFPANSSITTEYRMKFENHTPNATSSGVSLTAGTITGGTKEATSGTTGTIKAKASDEKITVSNYIYIGNDTSKDKFDEGATSITFNAKASTTSNFANTTPYLESISITGEIKFEGFKVKGTDVTVPSGWEKTVDANGYCTGVYRGSGTTHGATYTSGSVYDAAKDGAYDWVWNNFKLNNIVYDSSYTGVPKITFDFSMSGELEGESNLTFTNSKNSVSDTLTARQNATITATQTKSQDGGYALLSDTGTLSEKGNTNPDNSNTVKYDITGTFTSDSTSGHKVYLAINGECKNGETTASYIDDFYNELVSLEVKDAAGNKVTIKKPELTKTDYGYVVAITDANGNNLPNGKYTVTAVYQSSALTDKIVDAAGNPTDIEFSNKFYFTNNSNPNPATTADQIIAPEGKTAQAPTLVAKYIPSEILDTELEIKKTGTITYDSKTQSTITYELKAQNEEDKEKITEIYDEWPTKVKLHQILDAKGCTVTIYQGTKKTVKLLDTNTYTVDLTGVTRIEFANVPVDPAVLNADGTVATKGVSHIKLVGITDASTPFTVGNQAGIGDGKSNVVRLIVKDALEKTVYTDKECNKPVSIENPAIKGQSIYYKITLLNSSVDTAGKPQDLPFGLFENPDASALTFVSGTYTNGTTSQTIAPSSKTNIEEKYTEEFPRVTIKGGTTGTWILEYKIKDDFELSSIHNEVYCKVYIQEEDGEYAYKTPSAKVDAILGGKQRADVKIDKIAAPYVYPSSTISANGNDYYFNGKGTGVSTSKVSNGSIVSYAIKITNDGDTDAPIYDVTDTFPKNMQYLGVTWNGPIGWSNWNGTQLSVTSITKAALYYTTESGNGTIAATTSGNRNNETGRAGYVTASGKGSSTGGDTITFTITDNNGKTLYLKKGESVHFYLLCKVTGDPETADKTYTNKATVKTISWAIDSNYKDDICVGSTDVVSDPETHFVFEDDFTPGIDKMIRYVYKDGTGTASLDVPEKGIGNAANTYSAIVGRLDAIVYAVGITPNHTDAQGNLIKDDMPALVIKDEIPEGYKYVSGSAYLWTTKVEAIAGSSVTTQVNANGPDILTIKFDSKNNATLWKQHNGKTMWLFYKVTPSAASGVIQETSTNRVYVTFDRDFTSGSNYNQIYNKDATGEYKNTLEAEAITYNLGQMGILIKKSQTVDNTTYSTPAPVLLSENKEFAYTLSLTPAFKNTFKIENLKVMDTLPYIGDSNDSEFDVFFKDISNKDDVVVNMEGESSPIDSSYYTVTKEEKTVTVDGKDKKTYYLEVKFTNAFTTTYQSKLADGKKIDVSFPVKAGTGANVICTNKYQLYYEAVHIASTERTPITITSNPVSDKLPAVTLKLQGTKALLGATDNKPADKQFSFKLAVAAGQNYGTKVVMPETLTVKNNAKGVFLFDEITFKQAGEYTFTVSEDAGTDNSIVYDTAARTVTVKVVENGSDLKVSEVNGSAFVTADTSDAKENIYALPKAEGKNATINNQKKGTLVIEKTFAPADMKSQANKDLSFTVKGPSYTGNGTTVKYTEFTDSKKTFTNVIPGEYTVVENNPSIPGYSVETTYKVGEEETSKATVEPGKTETVKIENKYTPGTASVVIAGTKAQRGGTLAADAYTFKIKPTENYTNVTMPKTPTTTNKADGTFSFGGIIFNKAGTYQFKVSEVADSSNKKIVFDTTTYTISVVVEAKGDNLQITSVKDGNKALTESGGKYMLPTYTKGNKEASFINDSTGKLTITKTFLPKTMDAPEKLSFTVTGPEGSEFEETVTYDKFTDGSYTFNDLCVGEYTVVEENASIAGYSVTQTYKVNDNTSENAKATVVAGGEVTLAITNTYEPGTADLTIKGTKVLNGGTLAKDAYTFTLKQTSGPKIGEDTAASDSTDSPAPTETGTPGSTETPSGQSSSDMYSSITKNAANGTVAFDKITFNKTGTYVFTVTEELGNDDEIIYDTASYEIKVEVVTDGDNLKVKSVTGDATLNGTTATLHTHEVEGKTASFVNVKLGKLTVTKSFADDLVPSNFDPSKVTFTVKDKDNKTVATKTYDKFTEKSYTFEKLVPGTYTVVESNANFAGYTLTTTYKVGTTTTDKVAVDPGTTANMTVINEYTQGEAVLKIKGTKALIGGKLKADEYTFALAATRTYATSDVVMPASTTTTNAADGSFEFANIKFKTAGTYVFKVSETAGTDSTIIYDKTAYSVTVAVVPDGTNLKIDTVNAKAITNDIYQLPTYTKKDKSGTDVTASFLNEKKKGNLVIKKTFKPEKLTAPVTFKVTGPEGSNFEETVAYADFDKDTKTYTFTDLYVGQYTVLEENSAIAGYSVNTTYKVGSVTTDKITVPVGADATMDVINEYTPGSTSVQFKGTKELINEATGNNRRIGSGEFLFEVNQKEDDPIKVTTPDPVSNDANGIFTFAKINFNYEGTYHFTVKEAVPATVDPTVEYDTRTYDVVVEIEAKGTGVEVKSVKSGNENLTKVGDAYAIPTATGKADSDSFINEVKKGDLKIQKTVTGVEDGDKANLDKITFTITGPDNYSQELKYTDLTEDGPSKTLKDLEVGTYTVTETNANINGYSVATSVNGTENTTTIEVEVTDGSVADYEPTEVEFVNAYTKGGTDITLKGTKAIVGRDIRDGEIFSFKITQAADDTHKVTMPANTTSNNDGDFTFAAIAFKEVGDYHFTVSEIKGEDQSINYDTDTHAVVVTIGFTADNKNYEIKKVTVDGTEVTGTNRTYALPKKDGKGTFVNEYKPATTKLEVTKIVSGRNWRADDSYTFTMTNASEDLASKVRTGKDSEVTTLSATATYEKQTAEFATMKLEAEGTYTFTIAEDAATTPEVGMAYSTKTVTATVVVTKGDDGNLVAAEPTYTENDELENAFTPAETELQVAKAIEGRAWRNSEEDKDAFDFSVEFTETADGKAADVVMPEATTATTDNATQVATFAKIKLEKAGTYTFKIKEVIPADEDKEANMAYSKEVVTATVTVIEDTASNKLVAQTPVYTVDGETGNTITNEFTPVDVNLVVAKAVEAEKSDPNQGDVTAPAISTLEGLFTFTVATDNAKNPLPADPTAKNDKDGIAKFGTIKIEKDGTYNYTITETGNDYTSNDSVIITNKEPIKVQVKVDKVGTKLVLKYVKYGDEIDEEPQLEPKVDAGEGEDDSKEEISKNQTITNIYKEVYLYKRVFVDKDRTDEAYTVKEHQSFTYRLYGTPVFSENYDASKLTFEDTLPQAGDGRLATVEAASGAPTEFDVLFDNPDSTEDIVVRINGDVVSADNYEAKKEEVDGKQKLSVVFKDEFVQTGNMREKFAKGDAKVEIDVLVKADYFPTDITVDDEKTIYANNFYTLSYDLKNNTGGTDLEPPSGDGSQGDGSQDGTTPATGTESFKKDSNMVTVGQFIDVLPPIPPNPNTEDLKGTIHAFKNMLNENAANDDEKNFSFTITANDNDAVDMDGNKIDTPMPETATTADDGTVSAPGTYLKGTQVGNVAYFSTFVYKLPGTYNYTITEDDPGRKWVKEGDGIKVAVKVVEDADTGKISIESITYNGSEEAATITNTYIGEEEIAGTKTWVDYSNADKTRPEDITLTLTADGTEMELQDTDPEAFYYIEWNKEAGKNKWTYVIKNLPRYTVDGTEIEYVVTEEEVEKYECENSEVTVKFTNGKGTADFKNTYTRDKKSKKKGTKTGDSNNMALWLSLLGLAAAGSGIVVFYGRRKKEEEE